MNEIKDDLIYKQNTVQNKIGMFHASHFKSPQN